MPARRDVPPPVPPHLEPRAMWEAAFERELIRLNPHLQTASLLMKTHVASGWRRIGPAVDPKKAAQQYHAEHLKR